MPYIGSHAIKTGSLLLGLAATAFHVSALDVTDFKLGGGCPSLYILFDSTNRYAVYTDQEYLGYIGGRSPSEEKLKSLASEIQVVRDRNFNLTTKYLSKSYGPPYVRQLFPFDDQTAFGFFQGWRINPTNNEREFVDYLVSEVFTEKGETILNSWDVNALARARYGLTPNQTFLGKVGTNVYYIEGMVGTNVSQLPKYDRIYYRSAEDKVARNYFQLRGHIIDVFGATRAASTNKDVGFWGVRDTQIGLRPLTAPHTFFIEESFKEAKKVKAP